MSSYVLLQRRRSFTSRKIYVCLEILCFLQLSEKKFSSRNYRLRKSFSTVIMLTTNLCRFSICFLHDRQQNGNAKRSEFVEFDWRKSNKCSRYRGIFCRSSVILISLSPHIVSVALFSASSAKNASFFLIMNIHLLGGKTANVNLCLFCRLTLQSSHVRHQYGIFGGKSQTSFSRNATRVGS